MQSAAYTPTTTRAKVRVEPVSPSRHSSSMSSVSLSATASMLGFPIPTDLLLGLLLNKTLLASAALLVRAWLGSSLRNAPTSWATACASLVIAALVQLLWFRAWQWLPAVQRVDRKRLALLSALIFAQLIVWLMALDKIDAINVIVFTQYCEIWATDLAKSVRGRGYGSYATLLALIISFLATLSSTSFATVISAKVDMYDGGALRRSRPANLASPSHLQAAAAAAADVSVSGTLAGHVYLLVYALLTVEKERALLTASRDTGGRRKAGIVATIAAAALVLPVSLCLRVFGLSTLPPLASVWSSTTAGGHWPVYVAVAFGMLILDPLVSTSIEPHASTKQRVQHGWPIAVLACFGVGFVGFAHRPTWSQVFVAVLIAYALRTILKHSPDYASSRFSNDVAHQKERDTTSVQDLVASFQAAGVTAKRTVKIILASPDSRKIFQFLVLNLAFMGVQLLWGVWTNSLGLISDAIHMFFDCAAIGMGLFASVMAQWPTDSTFTHGYGRVETLSGFANGVFLILISVFIVFEAVQRIIEPPIMHNTTQLLIVSAMGLGVNLFGMWATGGHHHHGHSHSHDHGHDHGHSHGHSHNMMGVYLHVMADTLGSVGVIISTLLINQFGWTGFDPIASLFIAFMIVGSVIPLVMESGRILCLDIGEQRETAVVEALAALTTTVPTVVAYSEPRFWPKDAETLVGVLRVQTVPDDQHSPESVATQVELFLKSRISGLESVVVQLDAATSPPNGLTHHHQRQ